MTNHTPLRKTLNFEADVFPEIADLWPAMHSHVTTRLARAVGEPPPTVTGDLADDVAALDRWCGSDSQWRGELVRYLEGHLTMLVPRPDRQRNQQIRSLAADAEITIDSALPEDAVQTIVRHLGLGRAVSNVTRRSAG